VVGEEAQVTIATIFKKRRITVLKKKQGSSGSGHSRLAFSGEGTPMKKGKDKKQAIRTNFRVGGKNEIARQNKRWTRDRKKGRTIDRETTPRESF